MSSQRAHEGPACAACGSPGSADDAFCPRCGAAQASPPGPFVTPPTVVVPPSSLPRSVPRAAATSFTVPVMMGGALPSMCASFTVPRLHDRARGVSSSDAPASLDAPAASSAAAHAPSEASLDASGTPKGAVLLDPPTIPLRRTPAHNVFVPVLSFSSTLPTEPPPSSRSTAADGTVSSPSSTPPRETVLVDLDHAGRPLAQDAVLFVAPPPEIGAVRSAATSVLRGRGSLAMRLLGALPWAVVLAAVVALATREALARFSPVRDPDIAWLAWLPSGIVFLVTLWLRLPTRRVLSYVGAEGLAICDVRYRLWPPRRPALRVLRFEQVRDLTVDIAHHRGRISFAYVWHGADGTELLRIARTCAATHDGQRPLHAGRARLYDFCRAAERSWTLRAIEAAKTRLSRAQEGLVFPVYTTNCRAIEVRDGALVLALRSGEAVVPRDLLVRVSVEDGKVYFATAEGTLSLPCAQVGNVAALLIVLQHHMGVEVR